MSSVLREAVGSHSLQREEPGVGVRSQEDRDCLPRVSNVLALASVSMSPVSSAFCFKS